MAKQNGSSGGAAEPGQDIRLMPGGSAVNADGTLAPMPRQLAHEVSGELTDVIILLRASLDQRGTKDRDADNLTDSGVRADSLHFMADEKLRSVVAKLQPYV